MKREGTGDPRAPDIAISANVKMRELYFEEVPDPEVRFRGNTGRNSVWESRRDNLPDGVQEGVVYRDAGVRLRIASEVVDSAPSNGQDKEGENADQERRRQKTGQRETETKKEKK